MIDGTVWAMLVLLAGLAALAYAQGGGTLLSAGFGEGARLLLRYAPVLVLSFLAAGFAQKLIPQDLVRVWLGTDSGLRGIFLGTAAGLVTPAGPFVSMPIAAVLIRAGAGTGVVVAFLAAWSLLAVHRLLAWEVPILGWRFALLRYASCLGLPVIAGLLARAVTRG